MTMLCSNGSATQFVTFVPPLFIPPCPLSQSGLRHRQPMRKSPMHLSSYGSGLTDDEDMSSANEKVTPKSNTSYNTGTSIGSQGVGNMLFNEELLKSGRVDLGVGSTNRYRDFRGNEVIPKVDPAMKEWLLEIIPTLDEMHARICTSLTCGDHYRSGAYCVCSCR